MKSVSQILTTLLLVMLTGCASLSTFQTPQVLPKKKVRVGVGVSGIEAVYPMILEAYSRIGLGRNMDFGGKFTLAGAWYGTWTADLKYGIVNGPTYVAIDMGISYFRSAEGDDSDRVKTIGFYPLILIGRKHLFGGIKWVFFNSSGTFNFFGSHAFELSTQFPGVVVGLNIGSKFHLLPEANVYFPSLPSNKVFIQWGMGFQYDF